MANNTTTTTVVTLAQPGFAGRNPKWRIATAPAGVDPTNDARSDKRIQTRYVRASISAIRRMYGDSVK